MTDDVEEDLLELRPQPHQLPPPSRQSFSGNSIEGEVMRIPGVIGAAAFTVSGPDMIKPRRIAVLQIADDVNASSADLLRSLAEAVDRTLLPWDLYVTKFPLPRLDNGAVDVATIQHRVARLNDPDYDERVIAEEPKRSLRPLLAGLCALVGVGLGVGGSLLVGRGDDSQSAGPGSQPTATVTVPAVGSVPNTAPSVSIVSSTTVASPTSAATTAVVTTAVPTTVVPTTEPRALKTVFADTFTGTNLGPLLTASQGGAWFAPDFYVFDGAAFYGPPQRSGQRVTAIAEAGAPLAELSVEFPVVADGAGVVFRYFDDKNYTYVVVAQGEWRVAQVTDGTEVVLGSVDSGTVAADVKLTVINRSDGFDIAIDDEVLESFESVERPKHTIIGLLGEGPNVNTIRWDNLSASVEP